MQPIKAAKYTLLALNIIVCLSGLVMLITGSVVQAEIDHNKMSRTIGGYSTSAGTIICIIFGIALMFVGVFGFYATLKDMYPFLYVYSVIMFVTFLVQFITGVVALAVKDSSSFNEYVANVFAPELKYNSTSESERDFYQSTLHCCGWNGVGDYFYGGKFDIPDSCCSVQPCNVTIPGHLYTEACNLKITDMVRNVINAVGAVLLSFGIINFFSIGFSIFMARQISVGYQFS